VNCSVNVRSRGAGRLRWTVTGLGLAGALVFVAATPAAAATRIVAPKSDTFVERQHSRVVVRTSPGTTFFRAWLEDRNVTGSFDASGRRRAARLALRPGLNHLYVKTKSSAAGSEFTFSRFVVARRQSGGILGVGPLRVRSGDAPVSVKLAHGNDKRLRARLNGEPVGDVFRHRRATSRRARLGADDGVRFGRNRLRLIAFDESGRFDVESRRFRVSRGRPIASAGRDRSTAIGDAVRLDGRASRLARRGKRRFRWRIVRKPAGPSARGGAGRELKRGRRGRPVFRPRRAGIYEVRVSVRQRGRRGRSRDTTLVEVQPPDPPIGVTLRTIADGAGRIAIDGRPVAGTGGGHGTLSYALLDRNTRQPPKLCKPKSSTPFSGAVPTSVAGIQTLENLVGDCLDPRYMLILNGVGGVPASAASELDALMSSIGGEALAAPDRATVTSGCPFSAIGVPDAPGGSAFTNFNRRDPLTHSCSTGDLRGYLQVSPATNQYGFAFSEFPAFDTQAKHTEKSNTMQAGGDTYTGALTGSEVGGFHVVVVDPHTLAARECCPEPPFPEPVPIDFAVPTNSGNPEADKQGMEFLADLLQDEVVEQRGLLFLQSIGNPKPTAPAWDKIAAVIVKLGGSRTVFDQIDGSYAFVGGLGAGAPAEASQALSGQPGRVAGLLSRGRSDGFAPAVSDPVGRVVTELMPILYQPAQPFPPFPAGQRGANAYLARTTFGDKDADADVRTHYYRDWGRDWGNVRADISKSSYPGQATCGCTQAQFRAVKTTLDPEISKLIDVKNWIQAMKGTVDPTQSAFNLAEIGTTIKRQVAPPDVKADANGSELLIQMLSIAGVVLETPESEVLSIAAIVLGPFAGGQTGADGSELLGEIDAKTSDLSTKLFERFVLVRAALTGVGLIAVSDQGKLNAIQQRVTQDPEWKFNDPTPISTTINKGAKRWFYGELMSTAWLVWDLRFASNARDWSCIGRDPYTTTRPWSTAPDSAQYRSVVGIGTGGVPNRAVGALGIQNIDAFMFHGAPNGGARPPDASLADPIFKSPDLSPTSDRLGLYPQQFYEEEFRRQPPLNDDELC